MKGDGKMRISSVSIMNFFFMLGVAIVLAVDNTLFTQGASQLYEFYTKIAPQLAFAGMAFGIAVILLLAYVIRNRYVEIAGLFGAGVFSLIMLSGYLTAFPNIGSVMFAVWTLSTFMSIADTLNVIQDEKEDA